MSRGTKLELVYSAHQRDTSQPTNSVRRNETQIPLFSYSAKPGQVVFLEFPWLKEQDLLEVMENSRPEYVFDLRIAPRFDLGALKRETVFQLFESVSAEYIDSTSELAHGETKEELLEFVDGLLERVGVDLSRPIVFILGTPESSLATDDEVLGLLGAAGKSVSEVVTLPKRA